MKKLESIIKLIPVGTLILIALGFLNLNLYYQQFGIDILKFISASEIATIFLKDLLQILVLLIGMLIITYLNWNPDSLNILRKPNPELGWFEYTSRIFAVLLIIGSSYVFFQPESIWSYNYFKLVIILLPLVVIGSFYNKEWAVNISSFSLIGISIFGLSILFSYQEVYLVKQKNKYFGTNIVMKEQTIKSDSTFYYIGNTDKFIFFHDSNSKKSHIYKMDNVMEIIFYKSFHLNNSNE